MSNENEVVLRRMMNAKGKIVNPGDPVPEENEENLKRYREMGLIGAPKAPKKSGGKQADDSKSDSK